MDRQEQLRSMFLRFPPRNPEVKVFIDPKISGCDSGWINELNIYIKEVNTPQEADFIPIYIDWKDPIPENVWSNWIDKYPEKCFSTHNLLDVINAENSDITDDDIGNIAEMLHSTDWESINLGLSLLRTFNMDYKCITLAKGVIDTVNKCSDNSLTLVPFNRENNERIEFGNPNIIRYYQLWLHNNITI